jgi:hypothetical protein
MADYKSAKVAIAGDMVNMGFSIYNITYRAVFTGFIPPLFRFGWYHRCINHNHALFGYDETGITPVKTIFDVDIIRNLLHALPVPFLRLFLR